MRYWPVSSLTTERVRLDQDRACGFNRDTRQHRAGRISDYTGDSGLRERSRGEEQDH